MSDRSAPIERRYEKGFWAWVERQALELQHNPERRVLAFRIAWWVSIAFIVLGLAYMGRALWGAGGL